jgi:hypothetical protein
MGRSLLPTRRHSLSTSIIEGTDVPQLAIWQVGNAAVKAESGISGNYPSFSTYYWFFFPYFSKLISIGLLDNCPEAEKRVALSWRRFGRFYSFAGRQQGRLAGSTLHTHTAFRNNSEIRSRQILSGVSFFISIGALLLSDLDAAVRTTQPQWNCSVIHYDLPPPLNVAYRRTKGYNSLI